MNRIAVALILGPLSLQARTQDDAEAARAAIQAWSKRYAIDRPWVEMPGRDRGPLAYVAGRLARGIDETARLGVYRDLGRLLALDASTEAGRKAVLESRPDHAVTYAMLFEIDVFALWKRLIVKREELDPPWGKRIHEMYYSRTDGTAQRFEVRMPPKVNGRNRYPLVVVLKGGFRANPGKDPPFIQVKPSTRGVWGPCSVAGWDAMQVVAFMKRHYPVDPDRVSVVGFSAGASAAMHLVSRHADEFAGVMPMVAFGTGVPLFNLKNLPVAVHHGSDDWTSAVCNVRAQVARLKELKYPVTYVEYPRVGHSVPGPHGPLVKWMLDRKRDPCPESVALECESLDLGRSYWIRILEFEDPHRTARVEAALIGDSVRIAVRNVERVAINLNLIREKRGSALRVVEIGDQRLEIGPGEGIELSVRDGNWQTRAPGTAGGSRPYSAGAATNLYQGEPLLLVYGTGVEGRRSRLLELARKLSRFGGPHHGVMSSRFPVVADTDLTAEQEASCNLILIGRPRENRVTKAILPDLPIGIRNETLEASGRPGLALQGRVLSLLARHPRHPRRLVYLVAPFMGPEALDRFGREAPQRALIGSDGLDRFSQGDLVVQDLEGRFARQMQYDKDWKWIEQPGSDNALPSRFKDRAEIARALIDVMQRGPEADFALWWGPADTGMWGYDFNTLDRYDPESFTEADVRARQGFIETMIGGMTGRELKEAWARWGKNGEILFAPAVEDGAVEQEKRYRVRIPMDLYIKLGRRKKTLDAPVFGPPVSPEEFRKALFR